MRAFLLFVTCALSGATDCLQAQWTLQESHSTASLRGIHYVGNGIAWASGSGGTVLHTTDMGAHWQTCAVPDGNTKLDFRGVQAFDAYAAIVMSSGTGDLSRLYKTTDGCKTWKLVFTNPDKDGFWDTIDASRDEGMVIGDPVDGKFVIFESSGTSLEQWKRFGDSCYSCPVFDHHPQKSEALFAASNSVMKGTPASGVAFVTGGENYTLFHLTAFRRSGTAGFPTTDSWTAALPLAKGTGAGAFSFDGDKNSVVKKCKYVVVGGNYMKPDTAVNNAAYSYDGGQHWKEPTSPPHGYRSSVAYYEKAKTWITVGPNGGDISTDDGRSWRPLTPGPSDASDADKNWNALSLPFVVGSKGRIGILQEERVVAPHRPSRP